MPPHIRSLSYPTLTLTHCSPFSSPHFAGAVAITHRGKRRRYQREGAASPIWHAHLSPTYILRILHPRSSTPLSPLPYTSRAALLSVSARCIHRRRRRCRPRPTRVGVTLTRYPSRISKSRQRRQRCTLTRKHLGLTLCASANSISSSAHSSAPCTSSPRASTQASFPLILRSAVLVCTYVTCSGR